MLSELNISKPGEGGEAHGGMEKSRVQGLAWVPILAVPLTHV